MARSRSRRPLWGPEKLEQRQLLAGDVLVRMEITDLTAVPQAEFYVGEEFLLRIHVRDNRQDPEGIFQSFFDVNYDSSRLAVSGSIEHGAAFGLGASGSATVPGLIDEVGGIDTDQTAPIPRDAEEFLFSVPFRATAAGSVAFTADLAESPLKTVLFFDSVVGVDLSDIEFVGGTVEILEAAILVDPASGLQTTESEGSDTFEISLTTAPTSDVNIALSSDDLSEGTVSPSSVTFTPTNWDTPQTVTVRGVDDESVDGNVTYHVVTAPATSGDSRFSGADAADVSVTNFDNDSAGIIVTPTSGQTTEAGGAATFAVELTSAPTSNVTVLLSSSDTSEGTVSPASIVFTPSNWASSQSVTVEGQDDPRADGNVAYTIITTAESDDPNYDGLPVADLALTNVDNDSAGVMVQPTNGQTTEGGGTAQFEIVLTSQPTADVVIGIASDNVNEGTVLPSSVTFAPETWNVAQTITVTGQDDDAADGNIAYTIVTSPAESSDLDYDNRAVPDVSMVNLDNDSVGISVQPIVGQTTEGSGITDIAIVLNSRPAANVTIELMSSDVSEGIVSPASVTFTPETWSTTRLVTVVGQDDDLVDGNVAYTLFTEPAVSEDPKYNGWDAADVSMTNLDDDAAGFEIVGGGSLETTEAGGEATFTIALTSQPVDDVIVPLGTSNASEGTTVPNSVTFTPDNWDTPQTVTVVGQDDLRDDGDVIYQTLIGPAQSDDPNYNGQQSDGPIITNRDDDEAGITITATPPLTTSEAGGTASFSVVLLTEPYAEVSIDLETSDPSEGTLQPVTLVFDASNWNVPRSVVATGVDDPDIDGDVTYQVLAEASSTDPGYDGLISDQLEIVNLDNDTPGVAITPTSGVGTSESGASASVQVVLATRPTADVMLEFESSDVSEGVLAGATLTFTSENWSTPQLLTIEGVDDETVDGDVEYSIISLPAISADEDYNGLDPSDITVTNVDNDEAAILVVDATDLVVSEGGQTASFGVALSSRPGSDVVVNVRTSDSTEGTVNPTTITLTPENWQTPQSVVITGEDDSISDGDVQFTIQLDPAVSDDVNYDGLDAPDPSVTNLDDDFPGVTLLDAVDLSTTEAGGAAEFRVVLNVEPMAPVTIDLASSDPTEGSVSPAQVTFSPSDWDTPQRITVTGIDDDRVDGNVSYDIVLAPASSSDPAYDGIDPPDVTVTNTDDDVAGILVSPAGPLSTSESGGFASFEVQLTSEPIGSVAIALVSDHPSEGTLSDSDLTFDSSNWNHPREITVTGVDDKIDDGDIPYVIILDAVSITDVDYQQADSVAVELINEDDDTAAIIVVPISGLTTGEQGLEDEFSVVLGSEPTSDVTIPLTSSDETEGTLSTTELTFTAANWDVPQIVIVTGMDDAVSDGSQAYSIITSPANSSDEKYGALDADDISVVNLDNDTPGLVLVPRSDPITSEDGDSATFGVALATQPTSDVTLSLASNDVGEGVVSPGALNFSAASWDVPQLVTVTGVDDVVIDGPVAYGVEVQVSASDDSDYATLELLSYELTNQDNDVADVFVIPIGGSATAENGTSVDLQVTLAAQPSHNVTVQFSSSDSSEGTFAANELVFTPAAWDTPQTITVTGVDDESVDGTIQYNAVAHVTSDDVHFGALSDIVVPLTNEDDDSATVTLSAATVSILEGTGAANTQVMFDVTLSGSVEGEFLLGYETVDGSASAAAGDYVDEDGSVSFGGTDGESHTITLQVVADNVLEPDEEFGVTLTGITGIDASVADRISLEGTPLEFTILDDDEISISLTNVTLAEGTGGDTTLFAFEVSVSGPVQGGLQVFYSTSDGTATLADGDYVDNDGMLEFDGVASETQLIPVQVNRDARVERDEQFEVSLDEIVFLDPELAAAIVAEGGAGSGTILNDDSATVAFAASASIAIESLGTHVVEVVLSVPGGGAIGEEVSFDVVVLEGSTAVTPDDYVLQTTIITFPADSADGDTQDLQIDLVTDEVTEQDELIQLGLVLRGDGIGGAVQVAEGAGHEVLITEDPMTAQVSGEVWFDANGNGQHDGNDIPLPGVLITLQGTDLRDRQVTIVTMTNSDGSYRFSNLPAGSYEILETQPSACGDGPETLGQIDGFTTGTLGNDRFTDIVLTPGQQASGYEFGEKGLTNTPASRRLHLASVPALGSVIRDVVARGEELSGRTDFAHLVQQGLNFEVRQIGSELYVTGSDRNDVISFSPAAGAGGEHTIIINGVGWEFDATDVDHIVVDTGAGDDVLNLFDSPQDDLLRATDAGIVLSSSDFRLEAAAFELARAVSSAGGDDRVDAESFDYVLRLEGDWTEGL